jgi:transcriptional regulator with XRE-family HTH domain
MPCLAKPRPASASVLLKSFRLAAGLTQKDVGLRARMARQMVSSYEYGKASPRWTAFIRVLRVIGVQWAMKGQTGDG